MISIVLAIVSLMFWIVYVVGDNADNINTAMYFILFAIVCALWDMRGKMGGK